MAEQPTITVSLETADLIMRRFLPTNPNKLRLPHLSPEERAEVRSACFDFMALVYEARKKQRGGA